MKRAFEGTEFAGLEEYLEGPSALVVSKDDATAPARIICKFAKTAEALEVKAGVVEVMFTMRQESMNCPKFLQERASFQIAWKLTVTYHKSCSCT